MGREKDGARGKDSRRKEARGREVWGRMQGMVWKMPEAIQITCRGSYEPENSGTVLPGSAEQGDSNRTSRARSSNSATREVPRPPLSCSPLLLYLEFRLLFLNLSRDVLSCCSPGRPRWQRCCHSVSPLPIPASWSGSFVGPFRHPYDAIEPLSETN